MALRLGRTVDELRQTMTQRELGQWALYFEESPSEWEQSHRIEYMLARFATGFFKGTVADHMLLSEKQRAEITNQQFVKKASGKK